MAVFFPSIEKKVEHKQVLGEKYHPDPFGFNHSRLACKPRTGGEISVAAATASTPLTASSLMGQSQSEVASVEEGTKESSPMVTPNSLSSPSPPSSSMEDLVAEAMAGSDDENESLDQKAQRALECPCVADLRKGPCGSHFSEAFVCFIKSTAEEKGSDCVSTFVALQNCIKANPDAFSKDVLEDEGDKEDEVQDYKIYPPAWSKETKSNI